jgi:Transglycosylase SLT domain
LRSLGAIACSVVIFASSMQFGVAAHAERAVSATHRANGLPVDPFAASITEASKRFAVPERWTRSVMRAESAGEVRVRSQKGAMELMLIIPQWSDLRARYDLGGNPYDPCDNVLAGAAYISELYLRFGRRVSSPPTMQGLDATKIILRQIDRCRMRPKSMSRGSHPKVEGKQNGGKIAVVAKPSTLAGSALFVVRIASSSTVDRPSPNARPDRRSSGHAVVIRTRAAVAKLVRTHCRRGPIEMIQIVAVYRWSSHVLMG